MPPEHPDLLRFATAGSVDDGRSTLVGQLLYDTKSVPADQIEAVQRASIDKGLSTPDLSLLVDGLRAEREQGIAIDVATQVIVGALGDRPDTDPVSSVDAPDTPGIDDVARVSLRTADPCPATTTPTSAPPAASCSSTHPAATPSTPA
jgi:translation elongation factor EF-1alpha